MKPLGEWVTGLKRSQISFTFLHFPWRIFVQFFIIQVISFNILFIGLFFSQLASLKWAALFFCGSVLVSLSTAFFFTQPIHRIYLKILKLSHKKAMKEWQPEADDLTEEEVGEFSALEKGLNKIQKKLKKRKEQLYQEREETQAFMTSVQEGLVSISKNEKITFFNSRFATLFLDSGQMAQEQIFLTDVFRDPVAYNAFRKVLTEGKSVKIELQMETKIDNSNRYFLLSLSPLRKGKTNELYGMIGLFHDISDIKKTDQIRIDFVGNASHELRTPLTSVKGYIETLKADFVSGNLAQTSNFLQIISRNVDRLIDLVNDLLTISTLESHPQVRFAVINPMQLSHLVVSDLMILAQAKNQKVFIHSEIEEFRADPEKVDQVLRNLVTNAIKYIPENKDIHVTWGRDADGAAVLKVKDNGPGIPKEHHDRLFERFYRIDKGRSRDRGGTGLGLAIVKHIVLAHGGRIELRSEVGKGAEFLCYFPQDKMLGLGPGH
ncbi:MAG: PAS domain-containing protein [Bdellovibrionaceae bacterium]|nr:PAS domain-containing protein [Pseudobdellovibrionaceae bacterium]